MANVTSATPAQLQQLSSFVVNLRSIVAEWSQAMTQMEMLVNSWNATVANIIGTPVGTVVADTSGLSGIVPLTDTNVYAIVGYMETCLSDFYDTTHQQIFVQACGPTNMV